MAEKNRKPKPSQPLERHATCDALRRAYEDLATAPEKMEFLINHLVDLHVRVERLENGRSEDNGRVNKLQEAVDNLEPQAMYVRGK